MKEFLVKVLGISILLSVLNVAYLAVAVCCIFAIVIDRYFETKVNTLETQKKEIEGLANQLKDSIKHLESEHGVLKLKLQNITNPGRKL